MRLKLFLDNQKYDIFGYHISNKTSIFSILLFDNTLWYFVLYTLCYIICFNLRILNQYHYQL